MKMKKSLYIILLVLLYACNEKITKPIETKIKKEIVYDTLFFRNDTLLRLCKINNTSGIFNWSVKNKFDNYSNDTIIFNNSYLNSVSKAGYFSTFKGSCGSACNFCFLIKFKKGDKGKVYLYPLLIDLKRKIIVTKNDDVFLTINDLKNKKIININDDFDKTIRPPINVIDSISLKGNKLYVRWYYTKDKLTNKIFNISKLSIKP
jgi:hypothetical protein